MITVPDPVGPGRDTSKRRAAREALARTIWGPRGGRRLPRERELVKAMSACDPRDLWWVCEMSSAGPVYLLPTREWVALLSKQIDTLDATRVLEVAAGDGFLSRCLHRSRPRLRVNATDDASWAEPEGRMSARDRREFRRVEVRGLRPGANVETLSAARAMKRYAPDLVLLSWAPPGNVVEQMIRSCVRYVLDIGADGDACGDRARTWKYSKDFLDGPLEDRALCRLDARPRDVRHTRVTLYHGRAHPEYGLDQ